MSRNPPALLQGALRRAASAVAATAGFAPAFMSKEQARALPDSKGGEEPKQLQTYSTQIYTYFTQIGGTHLLYSAENWVRFSLELEDAGPVSVGTLAALNPVLSGRGALLQTDEVFGPYVLAKGTRLYVAAETVNRVKVVIEPIPWLEQLDLDLARVTAAIGASASTIVSGLVQAVASLRGAAPGAAPSPTTSGGTRLEDLPCPPPSRGIVPRLTPMRPVGKMRR